MSRLLARIGLSPRICGNCKNFDVAEGQKEIKAKPIFAAVSQHVTPAMMMRSKQIEAAAKLVAEQKAAQEAAEAADPVLAAERAAQKIIDEEVAAMQAERGEAPPSPPKPDVPEIPAPLQQVKWAEFGKCKHHNRLDWQGNTCESWA